MKKGAIFFSVFIITVINGFFYYTNLFASSNLQLPGTEFLLVVKNDNGELIEGATVKIEACFEGKESIYNHSYEFVIKKNPDLIGFPFYPDDMEVTYKITVHKNGFFSSKAISIKNIELCERTKENYRVTQEAEKNSDIPVSVKNDALELAKEAVFLFVVKLKRNPNPKESFEELRYSDQPLLLLHISESDPEKDLILLKWEYLVRKYPDIHSFSLLKKEADEILAEGSESVIIIYKRSRHPSYPSSRYEYYGNQSEIEHIKWGERALKGEEQFSRFEENLNFSKNKRDILLDD